MDAEVVADDLLEGLDPEQREAVASTASPLCVLAGAGSGKTRVLTRRVARRIVDGSADAPHTLVLTFTRKAADELRLRLHRLGIGEDVTTGTFHAVAYAQLRRKWLDGNRTLPVVTSQPFRVLETALGNVRMQRTANPRTLAAEISWAKSRRLSPADYEEGVRQYRRRPPLSASQIARVYDAYEAEKRKRKTVDYDDLLLLMTEALLHEKAFATTQRWRFRHFFVDEFQDLNKAQFDLLRAWLGDRDDLFAVGDPNQAIYGWNGADASYLTEIDRHFPGIEKVRLASNYRSTAHVLNAANAVLPHAGARRPDVPVESGPPEQGMAPVVKRFENEQIEAVSIARQIRSAHGRAWRWSDIAVLVRTNAQRTPIEAALDSAGIPYRSAGGAAWLYRAEVRAALEHLRAAPRSRLVERTPDIEQMAQEAADGRREYLDELLGACNQCLGEDPDMTIADFLSWVEVASRHDGPVMTGAGAGAVTVTTFHRAKGLEWPVVFLAGIEDGLVPYGSPTGMQLDEERRLFYVAVTRAREELHCSWCAQRSDGRGVKDRSPSPWLEALERAAGALTEREPSKAAAQEVIVQSRAVLHVEQPVIDEARTALEKWRAIRAKLTGIEPTLILSDDVVDAIVDIRPSTRDELAAVQGFGPVRAAADGDEILELLDEHRA